MRVRNPGPSATGRWRYPAPRFREPLLETSSSFHPSALGIEEDRRYDFDLDVAVANRIEGAQALATPLRPVLQQPERDPGSGHRRERDGRDVALVVLQPRLGTARKEMRTGTQPRGLVDRPQPDERRAIRRDKPRALRQDASDEILLRGHHAAETEVR